MFRLKLPRKHTLEDILHSKLKVSVIQFQGNYFALNCNPSVYIVKPDMCWPHAWFLEIEKLILSVMCICVCVCVRP